MKIVRTEAERKRRREYQRRLRLKKKQFPSAVNHYVFRAGRVLDHEVAARIAEIPVDTRSTTERFFGDPVHQRSALAKIPGYSSMIVRAIGAG